MKGMLAEGERGREGEGGGSSLRERRKTKKKKNTFWRKEKKRRKKKKRERRFVASCETGAAQTGLFLTEE